MMSSLDQRQYETSDSTSETVQSTIVPTTSINSASTTIERTSIIKSSMSSIMLTSTVITTEMTMPTSTRDDGEKNHDTPTITATATNTEESGYKEATDITYNTNNTIQSNTYGGLETTQQLPTITTAVGNSISVVTINPSCTLDSVELCSQQTQPIVNNNSLPENKSSSSYGQIIGIVAGVIVPIILVVAFCLLYRRRKQRRENYISTRVSPFMFLPDEDKTSTSDRNFTEKEIHENIFMAPNKNYYNAPFKENKVSEDALFYSNSTNYSRGITSTAIKEQRIAKPEQLYHYHVHNDDVNSMTSKLSNSHMSQNNNLSLSNYSTLETSRVILGEAISNSKVSAFKSNNNRSSSDPHVRFSTSHNIYQPYLRNSMLTEEPKIQSKPFSGHQRKESSLDPQFLQNEQKVVLSLWDDSIATPRYH